MSRVGVVTIGRNEGERLIRCLDSLVAQRSHDMSIVYVDSGSTDGSCEAARQRGVEVVALDLSIPFTAARARNAGFDRLLQIDPTVDYVQFFDGDCEVLPGWIEAAAAVMDAQPDVVAVCGWRRERYPERSPFNRICDVEWHIGPVGEISCFGGDVMIRAATFTAVGGYNPKVIAAEDDELGVRLRQTGGRLIRIDRHSTVHDADMHSVRQWWQRAKRCGYAYAQVSSMHGRLPERKFVKEVRRSLLWGVIIPLTSLVLAVPTYGWSLLVWGRYPLTAIKTILNTQKRGFSQADSVPWGISCALSAFPEALGVINFYITRWRKRQHKIIEYKGVNAGG
ncbi:MAG: glycosyltransferase family 2 protein [Cyanobacteria bacterium]|nr:glycosyltransferase family 2 protein [Cyanobacteriota bacterium]MDW8199624.1 glycosyltransferase family A protein [Cyanobacteriota bacterium SKYGB_h_bin112]